MDIANYAKLQGFPLIPCHLCGSQTNSQRQAIKQMLKSWERQYPGRLDTIFRSIQHVTPSHLADQDLFDFTALGSASEGSADWLLGR